MRARAVELKANGLGNKAIADALNEEGIPTPDDKTWKPNNLRKFLTVHGVGGTTWY